MNYQLDKSRKIFLFGLLIFFIIAGCIYDLKKQKSIKNENSDIQYFDTQFYTEINPEEAKNLIDNQSELVIIDVSNQYGEGHISDSINIPINEFENKIKQLNNAKIYLIYGRSSAYSIAAASRLAENGFENVYRLEGDYQGWINAGFGAVK